MKIILARHGESEHNAKLTEDKNSILTKRGRIHAAYFGKKLKKEKIKIDKIYASNMKRAKETAEIISKIIKVPIKFYSEELNEYDRNNLRNRLRILFNLRFWALKKILTEIAKNRERNKTILIVAYGVTNRMIVGHLLEIPLGRHLLRFMQNNTGLNILYWNKKYKNWGLESMNDLSHLPERLRRSLK